MATNNRKERIITYQEDFTIPTGYLERISKGGMAYLSELIRILVNSAMQAERQKHLGAGSYKPTPERQGYVNGYKPKTLEDLRSNFKNGFPNQKFSLKVDMRL